MWYNNAINFEWDGFFLKLSFTKKVLLFCKSLWFLVESLKKVDKLIINTSLPDWRIFSIRAFCFCHCVKI